MPQPMEVTGMTSIRTEDPRIRRNPKLRKCRRTLKSQEFVLSDDSQTQRDQRTFNAQKSTAETVDQCGPIKTVLAENMQCDKDATLNKVKKKKRKCTTTSEKCSRPLQNGEPETSKHEENGMVDYKKKNIITPPTNSINDIEEFIPLKKRKKKKDVCESETKSDFSVKYIYKKKHKKKSREVVVQSNSRDHEKPNKKRKKKKKDLDLIFQMKTISEEEPLPKKKKKHKESKKLQIDNDNGEFASISFENGKEKRNKKSIANKINENISPIKNKTSVPNINSKHKKSEKSSIDKKDTGNDLIEKIKNKLPEKSDIIEDFIMQISLSQSFNNESPKRKKADDSTVQNYDSRHILEIEETIANNSKSSDKSPANPARNKSLNRSFSEKTYKELDAIIDKWFKHDLKNIGNNKKRSKFDSVLDKKRRKSLDLPRELPFSSQKKKRNSTGNTVAKSPVGSTNDTPVPRKVGNIVEDNSEDNSQMNICDKTSEKTSTGDKDKNLHKDKPSSETEECLYNLIKELKQEVGLPELFRILNEQRHLRRNSTNIRECVSESIQEEDANQKSPISSKANNKKNKAEKPKRAAQANHIENIYSALEVQSSADNDKEISASQKTRLEMLRDNMNEDILKLIKSTVIRENGNNETYLSSDNDSSDSWPRAPLQIKQSPVSIKEEDLSYQHVINCNPTEQQNIEFEEENSFQGDDPDLEDSEYNANLFETTNTIDYGNEIKFSYENDQEITENDQEITENDEIDNDRKDIIMDYEFTRSLQQLDPQQRRVLQDLEVNLPFEPPLAHQIETRMSCAPSREQLNEFKVLGLNMKTGRFTLEEDAIIKRNWLDFVKEHDIPNDPVPFLYFYHPYTPTDILLERNERKKFVQYLSRDLNNRMLYSVHNRFKLLFMNLKKGRFTAEEDRVILKYMEQSRDDYNIYAKISHILNRTRTSVKKRFKQLEFEAKIGDVPTTVPNETIIKVMMEIKNCNHVRELEKIEILWSDFANVGEKLNMFPLNVQRRWLTSIYPALFSKIRDINEIKRRFITQLIKDKVNDIRKIKFYEYVNKYFEGFTGFMLSKMLRYAILPLPGDVKNNFTEALLYLRDNVMDGWTESLLPVINV